MPITVSSAKDLREIVHLKVYLLQWGLMVAAAASPPRGKDTKNGVCGKSAAAGQGRLCAGQHPEILR